MRKFLRDEECPTKREHGSWLDTRRTDLYESRQANRKVQGGLGQRDQMRERRHLLLNNASSPTWRIVIKWVSKTGQTLKA